MIEGLNDKQSEAVLATKGPLLILAGAGSGKTRVVTNRIAYLIQEAGVNPREILAITFTNKAATEMKERVEAMLGLSFAGAWICTFHSMCVRILRMHADLLGYETNFSIYDSDDSNSVIKNTCRIFNIDTKRFKEKWFSTQISHAKDKLVSVEKFENEASRDFYLEMVAKVYREYQKELKAANAMDFDDLIVNTVELFRKYPDVLERFQNRFRYISVDEYQDTNAAQFELVRLLADKYKNICVVGDDDQSIYKFRGADVTNILSFEKSFPGAKVVRLEQNYRSTKNILDAANAVIKNNARRKEKSLWTDRGEGAKIKFFLVDNPYEEADRIIRQIKKYKEDGFKYNDCACLYRTNAQSRNLEEAFIRENIPYKIVGGVNFYQRKEIKDVLAYLKCIDNFRDDIAVKRIINVPKRSIGKTTVDTVQKFASDRDICFYSALNTGIEEGVFGKAEEKLKIFTNLMEGFREENKRAGASYKEFYGDNPQVQPVTLKQLLEDVLEKSGYINDLKNERTEEAAGRIENIEELINKMAIYEGTKAEATLSGFLEEVSLVADIDSWEATEAYVSLITIHSAKGLEFSNVFLCGMEDGLFPMNAAICSEDESDLEEERRLAYVGITRAMKNLVISAAKMRMVRGETMVSNVSRFVKEIPGELIEPDRGSVYIPKNEGNRSQDIARGYSPKAGKESFERKPFGFAGGNGSEKKQFGGAGKSGLDYGVGDTVRHIKFGTGVVAVIDDGGKDYEVTVDFEEYGTKKMFASFAKLKKI